MGNYTTAEGAFIIKPELGAKEIRRFPEFKQDYAEIELEIDEIHEETPRGYSVTLVADVIQSADETGKHYYMEDQLKLVAKAYGSDHTFSGYIQLSDEEGKQWRYYIRETNVIKVEPQVTWVEPE